MRIIIYSETNAASIQENMGKAEYSYYFILEKYLPILSTLGDIYYVTKPDSEVDTLYFEAVKAGDKAVFLSFTPPHRTAKNLACPMICVLAWEYDSIPNETWDPGEPWYNWVEAIGEIGNVITISEYATRVIRKQVGRKPRVVTIPAPVVSGESRRQQLRNYLLPTAVGGNTRSGPNRTISLSADIIDSHAMVISPEKAVPRLSASENTGQQMSSWDGRPVSWDFTSNSDDGGQLLVGFYDQEKWGVWSRVNMPMLLLPWAVQGEVEIVFDAIPFEQNEGKALKVQIGDVSREIVLESGMQSYTLSFSLSQSAGSIDFSGFTAIAVSGARDHRTLGIGLRTLSLKKPGTEGQVNQPAANGQKSQEKATRKSLLSLEGTVYTSLFNPADGRKNWGDIVTAFCRTFRDEPDKTLVLKMSHRSRSVFLGRLLVLFSRLSPFKCRVVAVHGYLSGDELDALISSTHFFVNASSAEGQCLPLLEFMAQGVPAIAPDHTAMSTYINAGNAFIIRSSEQPSIWPHDPRRANRTICYRTDWESLAQAYRDSDQLLRHDDMGYREMCEAATRTVTKHYSSRKISKKLSKILHKVAK